MRIAFVSTILEYPWGGADTLWTHAAEAAQQRGDSVFLAISPLTAGSPRIDALRKGGAQLFLRQERYRHRSFPARVIGRLSGDHGDSTGLVRALKEFGPDLVAISCGGTYDLLVEPGLREWLRDSRTAHRLVLNWQSRACTLSESDRDVVRDAFSAAEKLFFVSSANLELTEQHLSTRLNNACVLHNPLRPAQVLPWPENDVPQLAFVGRLEAVKGLDLLLDAVAELLASGVRLRVNVYGRPEGAESYVRKANTLAISDVIRFSGYESDLTKIWCANEMLISPALDEGVPMTIPEAMLHARPVLATRVGGSTDWIQDGRTGFLCEPESTTQLVETFRRALRVRHEWREMGRRAAEHALYLYRPDDHLRLIDTAAPSSS
jgi:glycosyltransferase involved in cell wall biosynthesis